MNLDYVFKTGRYYVTPDGDYTLLQKYALRFSLRDLSGVRFNRVDASFYFGRDGGVHGSHPSLPLRIVRLVSK